MTLHLSFNISRRSLKNALVRRLFETSTPTFVQLPALRARSSISSISSTLSSRSFSTLNHAYAQTADLEQFDMTLNRDSSRNTIQSFLSNHPGLTSDGFANEKENFANAIYSYLSYKIDVMDGDSVLTFCNQLLQAHTVLRNRGVVICPTTVGYTLITTRNSSGMKSAKNRPSGKPSGICGTHEIYKQVFGKDPPLKSERFRNYTLAHMGKPLLLREEFPLDAVGPKGQVAIWTELGPAIEYLAGRVWSESREFITGTSCNVAGEPNPRSETYGLLHIHSSIRSKVDFEISIPHWETPDLDDEGRWKSAPIWDLDNEEFIRMGRDQEAVEGLLKGQH